MHLKTSINIVQFLDQVTKCQGEVWFTTTEGDMINLKSILSQYFFIYLTSRPDILTNGTILCKEAIDIDFLKDYFQKV